MRLVQFIPVNMPTDPQGLQCMLEYLSNTYKKVPVYVQENGKSYSTELPSIFS
jgi:beta-glucosidase/6-phospho-beta-glucosidase/beta-galactosidase